MAAPGRKVPRSGLVAVLSAAPRRADAKAGTSWIGSPPTKLRRSADDARPEPHLPPGDPAAGPREPSVELARPLPVMAVIGVGIGLSWPLDDRDRVVVVGGGSRRVGPVLMPGGGRSPPRWPPPRLSGPLVGQVAIRAPSPLVSSMVWRNELADTSSRCWLPPGSPGRPRGTWIFTVWPRSPPGCPSRPGVWCDPYWPPEADLIELEDGATVNQGCVVQTHLFHDRMLQLDRVRSVGVPRWGPTA